DPDRGLKVTSDTLFFAASTGKGIVAAVAHVLVERGELAYEMKASTCGPSSPPTVRRGSPSATC
ncbi:MAG TPA: serine hydrolase, partial [Longimicrobiales bacterium]|nr:serine hydrolase [Longimicrobiales bacterium]